MKFTLLVFCLLCLHAVVHGLAETGTTSYDVQQEARCPNIGPGCCTKASCSLIYRARGRWLTEQDRVANLTACTDVCFIHFKKCFDLCNCVSRQTEVRSTQFCKCKLGVARVLVRDNCVRRCVNARNLCVDECNTGKCPLKAVTQLEWKKEFRGRCDGICKRQTGLETVCLND